MVVTLPRRAIQVATTTPKFAVTRRPTGKAQRLTPQEMPVVVLDVYHLHFTDVNVAVGLVHTIKFTLIDKVEISLLYFLSCIVGSWKALQADMQ